MPSEYPEFLKNSLFSRIGQIACIRCVSLDSIALKSMWELYINGISSDIDGERCASDLAGGEACASRWAWRSVGIDDRSRGCRNHENHKKTINLGNIDTSRDYTYVTDVCRAYFSLLNLNNFISLSRHIHHAINRYCFACDVRCRI